MSEGLNQRFTANPEQFLTSVWDINSSQAQAGNGYVLDQNGVGSFDLVAYCANTVRIVSPNASFFGRFLAETPIRAYYLPSAGDQTTRMQIGTHVDFFFTDTITGCQFQAYGSSRTILVVEHVNALTIDPRTYAREALRVRGLRKPFTVIYGADDYRSGGFRHGETTGNTVVTVIGWRRGDGWHFFARRRLNDPNHRRAIDNGSFEI